MNNTKLDVLSALFDNIWLTTSNVPEALKTWQDELNTFITQTDPDSEAMDKLKALIPQWQQTMEINKGLLEAHQAKLMKNLAIGEESYIQKQKAGKFKLQ